MCKNRKPCKECPWVVKSQHNQKMTENIKRFVANGSLKTKKHRCHMIDTNIWNTADEKNVCIGSLN